MKKHVWLLAAATLWATPALADHHEEKKAEAAERAEAAAEKGAEKTAEAKTLSDEDRKRLMSALDLPEKADRLRKSGMADEEVAGALDAVKGAGLDASAANELLDAADSKGNGDAWQGNFGSWVRTQLDEGKRGQDLSEAIRAEREVRKAAKEQAKADGTWKGRGQGKDKAEEMAGKGKDDEAKGKGKGGDSPGKARMEKNDGKGKDDTTAGKPSESPGKKRMDENRGQGKGGGKGKGK